MADDSDSANTPERPAAAGPPAWFVYYTVNELPFSFDGWFATRAAITAALLVSVVVWSFSRSLAGRPLFGATFE